MFWKKKKKEEDKSPICMECKTEVRFHRKYYKLCNVITEIDSSYDKFACHTCLEKVILNNYLNRKLKELDKDVSI